MVAEYSPGVIGAVGERMADVTGILLDGWFLNKPELSTALPARVLEILNEWHD